MVSSKWHKQNSSNIFIGPALLITVWILTGNYFRSLGFERNGMTFLASTAVTLVAGLLVFAVIRYRGRSMTRVLRLEREQAEFAIRMMLKDQHIRYNRERDNEMSTFNFVGQEVTMTVQPYYLHNFELNPQKNSQPATLVTLSKLDKENQSFTQQLTKAIDEMAAKQPNSWAKTG